MSQLAFPLDAAAVSYREEDFLLSDSNQLAYDFVMAWPGWPTRSFALYGAAGSGKTHLAHLWAAKSGARFLTSTMLTGASALALFDESPAWILEYAEKPAEEAALFHLLNAVNERGGSLLLTFREAPARLSVALPDLASRLAALPAVEIQPPDDALLEAILAKQFADRQLRVGQEVLSYILLRSDRSLSVLRTLVEAIDRKALLSHRNIALPLVRELLEEGGFS